MPVFEPCLIRDSYKTLMKKNEILAFGDSEHFNYISI